MKWIQKRVGKFDPKNKKVVTTDAQELTYDYLIVAAGLQIDWDKIPGLKDTIGRFNSGGKALSK